MSYEIVIVLAAIVIIIAIVKTSNFIKLIIINNHVHKKSLGGNMGNFQNTEGKPTQAELYRTGHRYFMTIAQANTIHQWLDYWQDHVQEFKINLEFKNEKEPSGSLRMEINKANVMLEFIEIQKQHLIKIFEDDDE